MRGVVTPVDDASFRGAVLGSPEPVLVLFWRYGCPACEHFKPVLRRFAQSRPELMVRAYEIVPAAHGQIWKRLRPPELNGRIEATPTVVLFDGGVEKARAVGAQTSIRQLHDMVDAALGIGEGDVEIG